MHIKQRESRHQLLLVAGKGLKLDLSSQGAFGVA